MQRLSDNGEEGRKIAASFLFNPLFVIIPSGQTVHFRKKKEGAREKGKPEGIRSD